MCAPVAWHWDWIGTGKHGKAHLAPAGSCPFFLPQRQSIPVQYCALVHGQDSSHEPQASFLCSPFCTVQRGQAHNVFRSIARLNHVTNHRVLGLRRLSHAFKCPQGCAVASKNSVPLGESSRALKTSLPGSSTTSVSAQHHQRHKHKKGDSNSWHLPISKTPAPMPLIDAGGPPARKVAAAWCQVWGTSRSSSGSLFCRGAPGVPVGRFVST